MEHEKKFRILEKILAALSFVIAISHFDASDLNAVIVSIMLSLLGVMMLLMEGRSETLKKVRRWAGNVGVILAVIIVIKVFIFD